MKATLTDLGYSVMEAKTGEEALAILRRDPADLILLDLNMPGIAASKPAAQFARVPISPSSCSRCATPNATKWKPLTQARDDFVTKPFGIQELLARIRAAMRRMPHGSGEDRVSSSTANLRSTSIPGV